MTSGGMPAVQREIVRLLNELRADISVESEAQAQILHRLDEISKCQRLILRYVKHIHGLLAADKTPPRRGAR